MLGGVGSSGEANEIVQKIAISVKDQVEKRLGKTFETFDAVVFKTQVISGINYIIKVHVGDQKYIHIKVWVPPNKNKPNILLNCVEGKAFYDHI